MKPLIKTAAMATLALVYASPEAASLKKPTSSMCVDDAVTRAKQLERDQIAALGRTTVGDQAPTRIKSILKDMETADQSIRLAYIAVLQSCEAAEDDKRLEKIIEIAYRIDDRNLEQLKRIIDTSGWPVISKYGEEADKAAFLVSQHADRDVPFQEKILGVLQHLVRQKETDPENYALLFDRVLIGKGKAQQFGSQGQCTGSEWIPDPIEFPAEVDARRAEYGLEPLQQYGRKVAAMTCLSEQTQ